MINRSQSALIARERRNAPQRFLRRGNSGKARRQGRIYGFSNWSRNPATVAF